MSDSTIPAVLDALMTRLTTAMGDGVQVIYGPKPATPGPTPGSIVCVGGVDFTADPSTFGAGLPADETYEVTLTYEVSVTGTDQRAAAVAVLALYAAGTAALRPVSGDETLGVSGVLYARPTGRGRLVHASDARTLAVGRSAAIPSVVQVMGVI
jgi:hypothetical protein